MGNSSVELFIAYGWMQGKSDFRPLLPLESGKRLTVKDHHKKRENES